MRVSHTRRRAAFGLVFIGAVCFAGVAANADPITVPNFSFEDAPAGDGNVGGFPANWNVTGGGVFDPQGDAYPGASGNVNPLPAPGDGFQVAWNNVGLGGSHTISSAASLAVVAADTTYTLTVALGDRANPGLEPGVLDIELHVNGVPQVSSQTLGTVLADGTFTDLSTSFTTLPVGDPRVGGALTILLRHSFSNLGGPIEQANFDNVRLDATLVPEPTGLTALAAGALCLLRGRRR